MRGPRSRLGRSSTFVRNTWHISRCPGALSSSKRSRSRARERSSGEYCGSRSSRGEQLECRRGGGKTFLRPDVWSPLFPDRFFKKTGKVFSKDRSRISGTDLYPGFYP